MAEYGNHRVQKFDINGNYLLREVVVQEMVNYRIHMVSQHIMVGYMLHQCSSAMVSFSSLLVLIC